MNLANKLTIFRIILIPFFMVFLLADLDIGQLVIGEHSIKYSVLIATIIFAVASFTDWFDGYLARKHGYVTDFGKFMDPLADKVLVVAALVGLVQIQWVPAWIVVLVLAREFGVTGLRLLISGDGEVMAAKTAGKVKTFLQLIAIILTMLFPMTLLSDIFIYGMLLATLYSGLLYFKGYSHLINPNQ